MQRYYQESCLLQGYGNHLLSPCDTPLYVPAVVSGDFSNISLGKTIAFVSEENGVTRSCTGLDTFVRSHLRYNS